jgi:hypothetical protein
MTLRAMGHAYPRRVVSQSRYSNCCGESCIPGERKPSKFPEFPHGHVERHILIPKTKMECRTGCLRDKNCREEEPASRMELFQIVETHDQPRAAVQSGHFAIDCIS